MGAGALAAAGPPQPPAAATNAANAATDSITWTPLTDTQVSLAANAIAISPADHNIILVGTGEPDFAGVIDFLCGQREFSRERVSAALERAFAERSLW